MANPEQGRIERRLAAILTADIAGYSRLMGADESGTARVLREHRQAIDPIVASHGGRIVKSMGDGLLVEFPSIVAAVECAVAVQNVMAERNVDVPQDRRMLFRIGINLGDVLIDGDDILGDGVNIAARLEGIAEPGGIYISHAAYQQVCDKLDMMFEDIGEQQLKNIARPVRVYRVQRVGAAARSLSALPPPEKSSIAVLPFQNMSGDPAQDYFSDGITEDIITELSRFRSLFVVARNSSFSLRGKKVDVIEVGRRLGVRYVVEGSVRKAEKQIRVTVQLLDAASGKHLWGERYDRKLEDIFIVQDEITRTVVATLPGRLENADRDLAKRKQTSNITAYDLVLLGNERWRRLTRKDLAEALDHFRSAVALDPYYARAHANVAWTHVCNVFLEAEDASSLDEALRHVQIALDIDDSDAWSHGVFGQLLFLLKRDDEAEIHLKRALAFNPNDADVAAVFANILVYWGRWREALTWIDTAKRLNPLPPNLYHWYHALALYSAREYTQAIGALREMRSLDRWSHGLLAACYAQIERRDEARSELDAFIGEWERELSARGEVLPRSHLDLALSRADRYRNPSDREHFLEGLRKAGLTG
ncbi:adenylate/guanylate cyclase domain-containing protein [Bradyrhizobium sp. 147]|uniref:adenylate/guanylate cyclase domain-containing protein n=1 Tax=unclassified Bradyrhizobium TaxID=2631580 RepID=UPI001FF9630E|nr:MULTISPECIES: adenylate/guanylate cyclase domain-containing protein [unclassified Bradyrhizobium]MCK1626870.1 adenylate/guanylate cyclase domain-containing protein [Bradyrhizobium sp. 160]MCK1681414.1 adenylate/guanylate cyclase domain-containing protein [Bradyrhizobium sp. 147]